MNAWMFGTAVLVVLICVVGRLVDRQLDRGHEIRWHDRFYQPQLPVRRGRIIDVETRKTAPQANLGGGTADLPRLAGTNGTRQGSV